MMYTNHSVFMEAISVTDFPIRDHKVVLKLRRRRWKNKQTGESFVEQISVTEKGTRYSKEFAAFLHTIHALSLFEW